MFVDVSEHPLHVTQNVPRLDFEAPVSRFISEGIRAIVVDSVDLFQDGDLMLLARLHRLRLRVSFAGRARLFAAAFGCGRR